MPQLNYAAYLSITTWTIIIMCYLIYIIKNELIVKIIEINYITNSKETMKEKETRGYKY